VLDCLLLAAAAAAGYGTPADDAPFLPGVLSINSLHHDRSPLVSTFSHVETHRKLYTLKTKYIFSATKVQFITKEAKLSRG